MNNEQISILREKSDQGDALAQLALGELYAKGQFLQHDHAEARRWLEKAADQGNADAQCYLGVLYQVDGIRLQDYDTARQWYEKAAGQGGIKPL